MMDTILSDFITKTSADPGLSKDLLICHNWDLKLALNAFYVMKGIISVNDDDMKFGSLPSDGINGISNKLHSYTTTNDHITTSQLKNIINVKFNSEPSLSSPTSTGSASSNSSANSSPSKLVITRSNTVNSAELLDEECPKKLARGISRATDNVNLVSKARTEFAQDFRVTIKGNLILSSSQVMETPDYAFTLPDLSIHPEDFHEFLEKDLIEKSTLVSLEHAGRLNWWSDLEVCQRLWPLATTGDGNCLLHAASLGMWGFHDRLLTLRKALHELLINSNFSESFYRRWRWQSSLQNREAGLILCEQEWKKEWETLLKMASTEPRVRANLDTRKSTEMNGGKKVEEILPEDEMQPHVYESLEEIHILALAHVLKRPIVVIADTMLKDVTGEPFAPIPFGGIYLPIECPLSDCHKSPLCLTYDAAHFSALVAMDKETYADKTPHPPAAIPLMDPDHQLLPVQFAVDPGSTGFTWNKDENDPEIIEKYSLKEKDKLHLLKKYLDLIQVSVNSKGIEDEVFLEPKKVMQRNNILEKSMTLPSNFEFDYSRSSSEAGTASVNGTSKGFVSSSKIKAAKQLHMITKHFGSLGRSMSKKIKKNLGNLTRRGTSFRSKSNNTSPNKRCLSDSSKNKDNKKETPKLKHDEIDGGTNELNIMNDIIIAASLHTEKRHEYHEEMIRNYLSTARIRFLNHLKEKKTKEVIKQQSLTSTTSSSSNASNESYSTVSNYVTACVNTGCSNFGGAATNYLCSSCYTDQKEELTKSKCQPETNRDSPMKGPMGKVTQSSPKKDSPKCKESEVSLDIPPKIQESPKNLKHETTSNSLFYVSTSTN